jgi:hypothetical protein
MVHGRGERIATCAVSYSVNDHARSTIALAAISNTVIMVALFAYMLFLIYYKDEHPDVRQAFILDLSAQYLIPYVSGGHGDSRAHCPSSFRCDPASFAHLIY